MWVQEVAEEKRLEYKKVSGILNPADLMTKYLQPGKITDFMVALYQVRVAGRASAGLTVSAVVRRDREPTGSGPEGVKAASGYP